jgi:hypothetical protein
MNSIKNTSINDNIQKELNMKTFAEKEEDMKMQKIYTGWTGKGLLALALFCGLLLAAVPAWSAVDCAALADPGGDFDSDGILNGEECTSITLFDGTTSVPSCPGASSAGCLDPNKKDVFVILNSLSSSLIPADPFALVTESATGLDIVVHEITYYQANPTDRTILVRDGMNAVRAAQITENHTPATATDTKIGTAQQGMLIDRATVFTQRIVDKVHAACSGSPCKDVSGIGEFDIQDLIDLYMRHTIAHELGHILGVAPEPNKRFDGHHWKAGSGFVMDQSIVYTSRKGTVTFYITTPYKAESQSSIAVQ